VSRPTVPGGRALAGALVALLAAACGGEPPAPPPADRVALVGEEEITYADFEDYLEQQLGEPGRGLASDVLARLFDQFLEERLLTRLAVDRGLVPAGSGRRVALDRLLAEGGPAEPEAAEIEAYYDAHLAEFRRPERVRLRQLLLPDRAETEAARKALVAGGDFEEVARRFSGDAAEPFAGPQGELAREDLPPPFAEIIFRLAPGQVSDVVEADYGFHVFQVIERLPAQVVPLATAAAEIRGRLLRERADAHLAALAAEARSRYDVRVFERNLPFNYQGDFLARTTHPR
jgi:parvulin-like peptidyl-prolyl isomerase